MIKTQSDYDQHYPQVPLDRWKRNVVEAVERIGDKHYQSTHWLQDDRPAWEDPNEVVSVLVDDCVFNLFLQDCAFSFSDQQHEAAANFSLTLNSFLNEAPEILEAEETLNDPRWQDVQSSAIGFVAAFALP
ncbi:hypothetical protein RBB77_16885 [Tunturibacter psychrotolerans]|uniref:Uncharacterized protein n=1 Tax=Tunturiibacter psychrotolerans TaxID=3069686 RepID=A0AAU7ZLK3_9BACT